MPVPERPPHPSLPHIVVMGVSGAGKSTVARAIAERTGAPLLDADDLHPPGNRRKLGAGEPLTDDDRRPWLAAVRDRMRERDLARGDDPQSTGPDHGLVIACSALRRIYREVLGEVRRPVFFVELVADAELIAARLAGRRGHFASQEILESQLRTLEPLGPDENGIACPVTLSTKEIADEVLVTLSGAPGET
ncbi:gluconokinase, GntK/IdnK-type [Rhodococcus sp. IEGM 1408]|uniref:gluconokinase n=1 Tax=Rhodococcus sp. IEGM 1408 TaxID=3082220 RepID=UPI002953B11E|nr:gluconokinase, GntK/IdnK-type [Rhodococcus sp. IEGM 1408]MDV8000799.1 gluconokinase, GntK/IdnK-type [Rhodococcus sp. IEGM 1408]